MRGAQEFLDTEQCRYLKDLPLVHVEKIADGDPERLKPQPATPLSGCTRGQRYAVGEFAKALLRRIEDEARGADKRVLRLELASTSRKRSVFTNAWGFDHEVRSAPMRQCQARNIETSLFFEKELT